MERITGKDNPKFKTLSKLMTSKKERQQSGLFVAEGLRLCEDAVKSGYVPRQVFVSETFVQKHPQVFSQFDDRTYLLSDALVQKLSDTQTPQGVLAVFERLDKTANSGTIYKGHFVFLVSLQDPGNVGTIVRTAEALGIDGILMTRDCPDIYSPKVLRSTMGAAFRVAVTVCDDAVAMIQTLKQNGVTVYAAALTDQSRKLGSFTFEENAAVLIGNEGNGLSQEVIAQCDHALLIPMTGRAESLNAATAANIIAWEMTK